MSMNTKNDALQNWKLKEVWEHVEIVADDGTQYRNDLLEKLELPLKMLCGLDRAETTIDWKRMPVYHKFYMDWMGTEEKIKEAFTQSELGKVDKFIMAFNSPMPAVKVPVALFLDDWEGFWSAACWEGFMFSEDFQLIIEATRDYHLHSNFYICSL